jgi:hypothetical protein
LVARDPVLGATHPGEPPGGVEDPATARLLYDFVVVETARRAARAGCGAEALHLVAGVLPAEFAMRPWPGDSGALETALGIAASMLREEARRSISSHL